MNYQNFEGDQQTDRQTYYVDIHGKQVLREQGAAAYDLEIYASEAEVKQIEMQFRKLDEHDESTAKGMMMFSFRGGEKIGDMNDSYDLEMKRLFQMLYQCGTEKTKQHIESMNIL